jgi:alkanesulfonate monooxygenase SsuD/methylene tetrahydromethanopterin reductase-like flavin-dependent oxidoreductase (luciferase family)
MEFGISCNKIDEVGVAVHAENLGYDFCWMTDSPMIRSNVWSVMTLVAQQTQRLRLGTGVAVPGLRLAPVAANGIATINRLAPGRCFMGLGTGNTAMRMLGHPPAKVVEFREYIRVVSALLRGEEVEFTLDGVTHLITFANQNFGYINVTDPIPVHVGGFGPRAQALAGELGDGLITGIPRGGSITQALANVHRGAERVGRSLDEFKTYALVNLLMLEPGEALDSERAIAEIGSGIMVNVHYLVERWKETGEDPPDYVKPIWKDYLGFLEERGAARQHQEMHKSHYSYLDPEEARFITPEMIRTFSVAGQPEEIAEQLRDYERQGLDGINFIPTLDQQYRLIEDFARKVMSRM